MKGISTVIATILMLMITLALAGTAYLYISGSFTQQIQGLELVDSFCTGTSVTIVLRNVGTDTISAFTCTQTAPSGDAGAPCTATASSQSLTIQPGQSANFVDTCSGATPRTCVYRLLPPSGRSAVATVSCSG